MNSQQFFLIGENTVTFAVKQKKRSFDFYKVKEDFTRY